MPLSASQPFKLGQFSRDCQEQKPDSSDDRHTFSVLVV